MDDPVAAFVASTAGTFIGATVTYFVWIRQQVKEIRRDYDEELRTHRRDAYVKLWQQLEPFAVYFPGRPVRYDALPALGRELRRWYFHDGGLLMTERVRDVYFLLQNALTAAAQATPVTDVLRADTRMWTNLELRDQRKALGLSDVILPQPWALGSLRWEWWAEETRDAIKAHPFGSDPEKDFVLLQLLASSLRTLMARDIHSRDPSVLG